MPRSRLMTRSPWHNPAMVPDEQLQLSLRAGERLLWRGGPDPRKWYRSVEVTTSVFGVFWLGIVASAAVAGLRDGRSVFDLIPVVMLVLGRQIFDDDLRRSARLQLPGRHLPALDRVDLGYI